MTAFRRWVLPLLSLCLLFGPGSSFVHGEAVVEARFAGGEGESEPDQFPGISGKGWFDAWRVIGAPAGSGAMFQVEKTALFPDAGHCLRMDRNGDVRVPKLSRMVDQTVIDFTKPYSVSFQVRLDALSGNSEEFRFIFSGQPEGAPQGSKGVVWSVQVIERRWNVVGSGPDGELAYDKSQAELLEGEIYKIRVDVDPASRTYAVAIDSMSSTFASQQMAFPAGEDAGVIANELTFSGAIHRNGTGNFSWSLANLVISQP